MANHIVVTADDIELVRKYTLASEEVPYYNTIFEEINIDFPELSCRLLLTSEPRSFYAKAYIKDEFIGTIRTKLWSHEISTMFKIRAVFGEEETKIFKAIIPKLLNISVSLMYFLDNLSRYRKILFKEALHTYERSQIQDTSNQIIDLSFDSIRYALKESLPQNSIGSYHGTWGVRGHYRKYKSGKKIFIKPFEKGEGARRNQRYKLKR